MTTATRALFYVGLGPADRADDRWLYQHAESRVLGGVLRWDQPERKNANEVRPALDPTGRRALVLLSLRRWW